MIRCNKGFVKMEGDSRTLVPEFMCLVLKFLEHLAPGGSKEEKIGYLYEVVEKVTETFMAKEEK